MSYFYRKVNQIKKRNSKAAYFEIEQKVRAGLPRDLLPFIAPAISEIALKHNLKIGYQNYINASLGPTNSIMMVNKMVENLEEKIKNLGVAGKKARENQERKVSLQCC